MNDRSRRDVRTFGEQPDIDTETDRGGMHHAGQLTAPDDPDGERTRPGAARDIHSGKRTGRSLAIRPERPAVGTFRS